VTAKVPLAVRVQADVKEAAREYADANGLSLAAAVNLLLRRALALGNGDVPGV
jgi:antitoxin component of RelBE/YafQ-DinJ toxin-antitoxin module